MGEPWILLSIFTDLYHLMFEKLVLQVVQVVQVEQVVHTLLLGR